MSVRLGGARRRCGHGRPERCWLCGLRFSPALYWEMQRFVIEARKARRKAAGRGS